VPEENSYRFGKILAGELAEIARRRQAMASPAAGLSIAASADQEPASETNRPEEIFPRPRIVRPSAGVTAPAQPAPADAPCPPAQADSDQAKENVAPAAAPKKQNDDDSIQQANDDKLLGLAFSGGGIRSATFNLGILQGLAKLKLLHRVDYLSTVSGGGYIGAWLTAWIYRRGMHEVETRLSAERKDQPHFKDPPEIGFLREYSNYLTPRKGFLGADTWTAISIYLRNLLLNQLVLILFIAGILLAPRALTTLVQHPPRCLAEHSLWWWLGPLLGIGVAAGYAIYANMRNYTISPRPDRVLGRVIADVSNQNEIAVTLLHNDAEPEIKRLLSAHLWVEIWDPTVTTRRNADLGPQRCSFAFDPHNKTQGTMTFDRPVCVYAKDSVMAVYPILAQPKWIIRLIAAPLFAAAAILAAVIAREGRAVTPYFNLTSPWSWITLGSVIYCILWALVYLVRRNLDSPEEDPARKFITSVATALSPLVAGATGGLLLWKFAPTLEHWNHYHAGMWRVLGFGAPIVVLILLATSIIQMGLLGVIFSEPRREWWGRLAAFILIICLVWTAAFLLSGYAPLWLLRLSHYPRSSWLTAIAWVVSTAIGVLGGNSAKASGLDSQTGKDVALSVTPYIFIVGLLMLVSLGIHEALVPAALKSTPGSTSHATAIEVSGSGERSLQVPGNATVQLKITERQTVSVPAEHYWQSVESTLTPKVYWALLICLLASFLLALRVDLNEFSMHYLYRNRLVRCYLGASHRERVPNPFPGFDTNDDLKLASLTTANLYDGPFPIFNAALNLVHGKDLAWQERKAESFIMTPLNCGFDVWYESLPRPGAWSKSGLEPYGYRSTPEYAYPGGFFVGTAMAISGAAASPNMGFHSSPALAFLMTVFNVRLGWWVGNPRHRTAWRNAAPLVGLGYLLAELFGETDDEGKYVYLSDGGHFENLGLYELVKRRCRFIIASDAGADENFTFGDLASAIRKCRSDMGIEIRMRTDTLFPSGTPAFSKWHCAIGDILYKNSDRHGHNGILVYIKSSLTSDESPDVLNYKTEHSSFPHQTTVDQWFTESQFEAYRTLGEHIIQTVFQAVPEGERNSIGAMTFEGLFQHFGEFWKNDERIECARWPVNTGP